MSGVGDNLYELVGQNDVATLTELLKSATKEDIESKHGDVSKVLIAILLT